MIKFIQGFDLGLEKLSRWSLILCLVMILTLAVLAIVLRWLGSSPMWIDPLVRHLVFLSAFLGGSLATSKGVHIRIDLVSKLLESAKSPSVHWVHRNLLNLFCLVTCLLLMQAGVDFFEVEKEFGAPAFLEIHSSYLVAIVPFGLGLIALRFFNQLFLGTPIGDKSEHSRLR